MNPALQFLTLQGQNFGSFSDFLIHLSNLGLVLVRGQNDDAPLADSNGSGKSLILEALVWCLWGQTIRGLKADDVVNEKIGKDCFVQVTIEENGHIYTVRRHRLMSGEKPNNLFFLIDGQESSQKSMDAVQEQVDSLLGLSFDTFCAMMPGAKIRVAEMTDAKIKELLESLLQTEKFSAAYKVARDRDKALTLELNSLLKELPDLENTAKNLSDALDRYEAEDKDFENQLHLKREHWKQKYKDLLQTARGYQTVIDGKDDLDRKRASLEASLTEARDAVQIAEAAYADFLSTSDVTRKDAFRNLTIIIEKLTSTNSKLEEIANIEANCEHCQQSVPEAHKEVIKQRLKDDQRMLGAQHKRLEALMEVFENGAKARAKELAQDVFSARRVVDNVKMEIQDVLRMMSTGIADAEKHLKATQASISEVDKLLSDLALETSPYDKLLKDGGLRLTQLKEELAKKASRKHQLEKDKEYTAFWVDSFSPQGLRSHLLEHVTPYLNDRVKQYADLLTEGELRITFHTQSKLANGATKEKFYIDVQQSNGAGKYKGASDGEKRRADICIAFALGDLAALRAKKTLPFRFLDEPFENLDESGIQAVIQLLKTQSEQFETVFVITHNDQLKAVFPKEIVVRKQGGLSTIVPNDLT